MDGFQSAYKAGHSCETALLRVYNDIVTTIGKGKDRILFCLIYLLLLILLIMKFCLSYWRSMSESQVMHYS